MSLLVVRLDVDTHVCVARLPKVVAAAEEMGVPLTIFVNLGRAVSRGVWLKKKLDTGQSERKALSPRRKLGNLGYLVAAGLNPGVGVGRGKLWPQIKSQGHMIGLHGGRNHADWQRNAHAWNRDRLADEIRWGMDALQASGIDECAAFASPGWTSPESLPDVLSGLGFSILADDHGSHSSSVQTDPTGLTRFPTNLSGEPGGVGYFENILARGLSEQEAEKQFIRDIRRQPALAVVYDHPLLLGGEALPLFKRFLAVARQEGAEAVTIEQAIERVENPDV